MQRRRFAAIMFTDMVGYTALMGRDEELAFKTLRKNRRIHKVIIRKYKGKWLKEMGFNELVGPGAWDSYNKPSCPSRAELPSNIQAENVSDTPATQMDAKEEE